MAKYSLAPLPNAKAAKSHAERHVRPRVTPRRIEADWAKRGGIAATLANAKFPKIIARNAEQQTRTHRRRRRSSAAAKRKIPAATQSTNRSSLSGGWAPNPSSKNAAAKTKNAIAVRMTEGLLPSIVMRVRGEPTTTRSKRSQFG